MTLTLNYKDKKISIGDVVKVTQIVKEGEKKRSQSFEGVLISIKGGLEKTFTVRRIGSQKIGIERIFPLNSPTISDIDVVKSGLKGVRHAKLYFIRKKSKREIDKIYSRYNLKT